MSNPQTMTPHDGARFILKLARDGWTATQLAATLGGRPSAETMSLMVGTFRSPDLADEFLAFWGES